MRRGGFPQRGPSGRCRWLVGLVALALALPAVAVECAYEQRSLHDPNGIGKFYLGREIAHVMGPGGIPWLERPERMREERPDRLLEVLGLQAGDVVADLGAGSGYYSFRMAPLVGPDGRVLAIDIQDEMLEVIAARIADGEADNVEPVKATREDPGLAPSSVDLVLMVDVYHELEYPCEVMLRVIDALKPGGRVVLVEYRAEDRFVPIKRVHKMSEAEMRREMAHVGLRHVETIDVLPWQHIGVFAR